MAEVLGAIASGVTLVSLFKACIEAFDLVQTLRHQEVDFKKLKLRLNIEKCRLYIWGESMGLTDTSEDSHKIKDKYGCKKVTSDDLLLEADQNGPVSALATSFSNFSIRTSQFTRTPKILQSIVWVIHDRKKFGALVAEIKELVDSLQGITSPAAPVARQAGAMRRKIADIQDVETLSMIAEVCSGDHPDIASAASTKADTISLSSTHHRHVVAWSESVQDLPEETGDRLSPDLESWTVTDLKHKVRELMQERKEHKQSILSVQEPWPASPRAASVKPLAAIPFPLHLAAEDSNKTYNAPVLQTKEQVSSLRAHTEKVGTYESTSLKASYNPPHFTNPFITLEMVIETYQSKIPLAPSRPTGQQLIPGWDLDDEYEPQFPISFAQAIDAPRGIIASTQNTHLPTSQNTLEAQRAEPISPLAACEFASFVGLSNFRYDNPPGSITYIYGPGTGTQRPPPDSYSFPTTYSASSYSTSSTQGYPYYAGSTSGSVDDGPTDGSSITSEAGYGPGGFRAHPRRPSELLSGDIPPAPQSMIGQFNSNMSSSKPKKHICGVCDKRFTRPSSLQTHLYSHSGEKPFVCNFEGCGRQYSVATNLRRHRKVHRGVERRHDVDSEMELDGVGGKPRAANEIRGSER